MLFHAMAFTDWKVDSSDRVTGDIKTAVKMDGTIVKIGAIPPIGGVKVTRHHLIDIRTLQDCWNKACDLEHTAVIEALATWAGAPTKLIEQMKETVASPAKVIQQICWNPFNIVIGPSSTIRPQNPGDREFDFIAFIQDLNVARLEFNDHLKRLRSIEQYMKLYIHMEAEPAVPHATFVSPLPGSPLKDMAAHALARNHATNEAIIKSLVTLLYSDRPSVYPVLFGMLRNLENPNKAEMNQVADQRRPDPHSVFSPDYLPGALIDPVFWDDSFASKAQFAGPAAF